MLTQELLKANEVLKGLTDEQYAAIAKLSENDENTVIGKRFSETYQKLDSTIEASTGVKRNGDEKTYNYLERAAKQLRERADKVEGLNKEITTLKMQLAGQGGEELAAVKKDLESAKKKYAELQVNYQNEQSKHAGELLGLRIDAEIAAAESGIKLKAGLPKAVADMVLAQAAAKLKGYNPEFKDGKISYRDAEGTVLSNPENQLNPYSTAELFRKELKSLDVLEDVQRTSGGGTGAGTGANAGAGTGALAARTQVEAMDVIGKQLMQKGLINGSSEYQSEMNKMWQEYGVSKLPVQ